jgi:hypothetical protein
MIKFKGIYVEGKEIYNNPNVKNFSLRLPTTKVVHCKRESYDVYIGRPSEWGNPFSHKEGTLAEFKVATRREAIEKYKEWILTQPQLLAKIPALKGKILGCWCHPLPCHGHVLAEMAENHDCSI